MKTLVSVFLVIAGVVFAAPAHALKSEGVTATAGTVECWNDGKDHLVHFVVFNHTDKRQKYVVEYKRSYDDKPRRYKVRVPRRQGINDGVIVKIGASIDYITVEWNGSLIYYRTNYTAKACQ